MDKIFDKAKQVVKEQLKEQLGKHGQGGGGGGGGGAGFPGHSGGGGGGGGGGHHVPGSLPTKCQQHAVYPYPGQHPPGPGNREHLKAKNVVYHDRMQFYNDKGQPHDVARDLGFTGVLDGRVVWTFGDTLMGNEQKGYHICAVDSTCISTDLTRPMHALDAHMNGNNVGNFIPCNDAENKNGGLTCFSFGGTNIVEVAPGVGLCYYLKVHRPGGNGSIKGAGVATVRLDNGIPRATRNGDKMWTEWEPSWGDVGIALDPRDSNVYVYGHGPSGDKELGTRTFLARVHKDRALDVGAYEYWLGEERTWTKQRLSLRGLNGTRKLEQKDCIFWWMTMNQANPFWSNYFNCWMILYGSSWSASDVLCKTADRLEGPWKDHGPVGMTAPRNGEKDGFRYCQTGHPEFDQSGRTVLATWTKNNIIWGCTIEWE